MPALAQQKALAQDLKTKKTKSRNGCGRCKLKRLKCDETAGSCLQCKKRNVPCPGYEKTLKWSTKYEVFQPTEFTPSPPKPRTASAGVRKTFKATGSSLPKSVANGIEALAAVLPAGRKSADVEMTGNDKQSTPPLVSSPSLEELVITQESSEEDEDSPRYLEPFPMDDINVLDSVILDGFVDTIPLPNEESHFDPFNNTDLDSTVMDDFGSFGGFDFNANPSSFKHNESSTESFVLTTCESSREASPPRLSRSLLLGFYRLPSPSPNSSSPDDQELLLIQHYFKDVCAVFSSFDSHLNPFRTTIGKIYQDSPSISYAIQSMSAAHLANTFPSMAAIGNELQRKAVAALQEELPLAQAGHISCTRTFLSIMMLGFTTSWHDSNALGTEFLAAARGLILPKLMDRSQEVEVQREAQFFEESLIYWEMVMGFVTEDAMSFSRPSGMRPRVVSNKKKSTPAGRRPDGKIVPHPWTGVAPMIQALFAEVGLLVRSERSLNRDSVMDLIRRQENLFNATSLEEDLLAVDYPSVDEIADTGDDRTPKEHFTVLAEVYRCAGLLELYRVFPSILYKRLGSNKLPVSENVDFHFPMPRFETPHEDADMKLWLNSLAMHILQMIESLPASSGTFCIQQLVLTVAACELKLVSSVDFFDVHANDSKVLEVREKVIRRLEVYAHRLPGKPLRRLITLIKETWRQSDEGNDAFWIDIMNEKGWHTII
ncbi:hypothetical protein BU25DRAFT_427516 [Macroventuria anomochaeta]|uniref:Uncharacterized protein n=1 Tax=Macroventuria anomochaeta TaxID=301207 RepID=A0ACB6SFA8_9PLEO|nr:uncharacterized protein BU25DRAFT_427516 [Macroventuria anomochaeta]KAF2632653.1 hypothetical protein BU25DRAFT_427516 [Macroventuria anomochaeta]